MGVNNTHIFDNMSIFCRYSLSLYMDQIISTHGDI